MPQFQVRVEEILARTYVVNAPDENTAYKAIKKAHTSEQVVLDDADFLGTADYFAEEIPEKDLESFNNTPRLVITSFDEDFRKMQVDVEQTEALYESV